MATDSIMNIKSLNIPERLRGPLADFTETFYRNGYECYLVGGSVRDLLLGQDTYDYDFATSARPEQVMKLFRRVAPTGIKHGTVTVLQGEMEFEVTTYRADGKYLDGRRPESVSFSDTLEEDVQRRDFTINGLAYDMERDEVIDLVGGVDDLERGVIRTIGSPIERFSEDGLRTYRACRFAAKLGFEIEPATFNAISDTLNVAEKVSAERIREELMKLLATDTPSKGFEYMRRSELMKLALPELDACYAMEQNRFHAYDIYYHSLYSCDAAPKDKPLVRLSALLHDIGKVPTRRQTDEGEYTFYNHEVIGARMVRKLMRRLKFSNTEIDIVNNLVINHMFHYTDDWSDGAVRRFMRKVGVENISDLFELREADRIGNGTRTGLPEPIKKLQERIDAVIEAENAITVRDLNINGNIIMEKFNLQPGPLIGRILHDLLEMVLDEPEMNSDDILLKKAEEIFTELKNEAQG
ncbi:MAG TPA: CCA tRNA nucleotidyltransferase [Spirochaetota bacterium]|nr:CCA tRNA nucleotidyltransferase [Spirochaetota bacterium]HPJ34895.1 CCA tRNA nucleotidyltransferase [Spirochaetota bacterium]